jgi:GNAT superfamily N-acetyltransferase
VDRDRAPDDDRLRALWDVLDLDATERRLREALAAETTDEGRAEVLTQLARLESWHDRLESARSLLDEADALAGESGVARTRVLLERARLARRTDGEQAALPLAERAYATALAAGAHFVAADAAHSCALLGDLPAWTERGLDLADRFPAAAYWRGTLLINLGDWHWQRGEFEQSLETFRAALAARERETRNPSLTEEARAGVARALRALGRSTEALPLLEQVVRWVDRTGFDLPEATVWRQELAAAHDDVGRHEQGPLAADEVVLRLATPDDAEAIDALMKASAEVLFPHFYDERQSASAVRFVAQVDPMLLADGTYFVLEAGGEPVGCGGWSRRDRLYTGSGEGADDARLLDPATEPARVRAMFVRADWTRRGLGRRILEACETAARAEGFTRLALMATRPGVPLYRAYGFEEVAAHEVTLPDGVVLPGLAMERPIDPPPA